MENSVTIHRESFRLTVQLTDFLHFREKARDPEVRSWVNRKIAEIEKVLATRVKKLGL